MFIDGNTTMQEFPDTLTEIFTKNGWKLYIKYRIYRPGDTKTEMRYADVRLFRSVGSDLETRYFGMVFGYGGDKNSTRIVNTEETISKHSPLAVMKGTIDGINKVFEFPIKPVLEDSEGVFIFKPDGTEVKVPKSEYTVDYTKGILTFNDGSTYIPQTGDVLRATYIPSPLAPRPVKRLGFFTFDDVRLERMVIPSFDTFNEDDLSILPKGDGSRTNFPLPVTREIKGLSVYVNGVKKIPGPVSEGGEYIFDSSTNTVVFHSPPPVGSDIRAEYIFPLAGTDNGKYIELNDVLSGRKFDPNDIKSVFQAVYSTLYYLRPSPPTALSVTPLDNFGYTWRRDSKMFYWGNVNKDRIMMFFRPDPSADPENTYFAPLYIGRLRTLKNSPMRNLVIMAGARNKDLFTYAPNVKIGYYIVDYGPQTTSGNEGVQLQQTIGGVNYNKHYLSFITPDKDIDNGEARLNPSVYSGKYHISPFFVVHPNDGVVGTLDDVFAVHPKNIAQLDELEIDYKDQVFKEEIGIGTGERTVYWLTHSPSYPDGTDFSANPFTATPIHLKVEIDCVETTDYTFDPETKAIKFNSPPPPGAVITAEYKFLQVYRFTLPDTEVSPWQLPGIVPYAPIGIAMLKETKTLSVPASTP